MREISDILRLSKTTVNRISTDELGMDKVCTRCVPRILRQDEKDQRVVTSMGFLRRYEREGERFLRCVITTVETTGAWSFVPKPLLLSYPCESNTPFRH